MGSSSANGVLLNTHVGHVNASDNARIHIGNSYSVPETPNKSRNKFLRGLNACPYGDRKDRNPDRASNTCEWFTSHELFQNWQVQESGLLWVSADPGCGKSVLSRYLIDDCVPTDASRTTCYFFFKDDFEDQKTPESALCCILHQLFIRQPSLVTDDFMSKFEQSGTQLFASFRALWQMLLTAASRHTNQIVCILDALDECIDSKTLISALMKLFEQEKCNSKLKFLVTSRPYGLIGRDFQTIESKHPIVHLSGEGQDEVDKISREITLAVAQRVDTLGTKLRLSAEEKEAILAKIASVADRTYLWADLVLAHIEKAIILVRGDLEML